MTGPQVRVAVVGAGYFGQFHFEAWSRMQDCLLVGLCAREGGEAAAARFGVPAVYATVEDLLDGAKPDLIDIVVPPHSHASVVRAAIAHVDWIICQKPFCQDTAQADTLIAEAAAAKVRLAIHENFRFQPWYREIARLLPSLGTVWQAVFRLRPGDGQGQDAYLERQPYFRNMERFLVRETAVHWIDTFRYLFGEIAGVSADLRRLNPAIAGEDAGVIQFACAGGTRAIFDGNRLADHAAGNRRLTMGEMEIDGERGSIRLDGDGRIWLRSFGANEWREHAYDWRDHLFGGDCVYLTCRSILDAFRAGRTAETEAAAYQRNQQIVEAIYRSNAERRWIDL